MVRSLTHSNRGRSLETAVVTSQRDTIRVAKMSAGMKWLPGGKKVAQKGVVDFVGAIIATGRAIHFDAKQSGHKRGFLMDLIEPHQLAHLELFHCSGAVAGVLAECTAADVAAYFWLPAPILAFADRNRVSCVPWDTAGVTRLGGTKFLIPFASVPAVAAELAAAAGRKIDEAPAGSVANGV